jgi:hypothetical protein
VAEAPAPAAGWVRRHKILTGVGVLLAIGLIGSAFDESAKDTRPAAAAVTPTPEAAVTAAAKPSPTPSPKAVAKVQPKPVVKRRTSAPKPAPRKVVSAPKTDPQFGTCREANAAGYGPYVEGQDPEYDWYRDRDHDGVVCER